MNVRHRIALPRDRSGNGCNCRSCIVGLTISGNFVFSCSGGLEGGGVCGKTPHFRDARFFDSMRHSGWAHVSCVLVRAEVIEIAPPILCRLRRLRSIGAGKRLRCRDPQNCKSGLGPYGIGQLLQVRPSLVRGIPSFPSTSQAGVNLDTDGPLGVCRWGKCRVRFVPGPVTLYGDAAESN
jgi:hypothetical protein